MKRTMASGGTDTRLTFPDVWAMSNNLALAARQASMKSPDSGRRARDK